MYDEVYSNPIVQSALINMYAKCGRCNVWDSLQHSHTPTLKVMRMIISFWDKVKKPSHCFSKY